MRTKPQTLNTVLIASLSFIAIACGGVEGDEGRIINEVPDIEAQQVYLGPKTPLPTADLTPTTVIRHGMPIDPFKAVEAPQKGQALPAEITKHGSLPATISNAPGTEDNENAESDELNQVEQSEVEEEIESGESEEQFADGCAELQVWKNFAAGICEGLSGQALAVQPKSRCSDGRYHEVVMACDMAADDGAAEEVRLLPALILGGFQSCKSYDTFKEMAQAACDTNDAFVYDIKPFGRCSANGSDEEARSVRVVCAED